MVDQCCAKKKKSGKYKFFSIPKSQAPRVAFDGPAVYFQYKVKLVDFSTVSFLNALKLGTEVDHNTDSMFPVRAAWVEGCVKVHRANAVIPSMCPQNGVSTAQTA